MIHNSLVCLRVRYCVQLLPEVIFSTISFTFLCYFFFYLASFFLESKPKVFSKILVAANQKTPWMIMIHNSLVCLRVRYCVQLLPEVIFSTISFTFLCYFFFYLASFFLESKPKVFSKILVAANQKTPWMIMIHNSMVCLRVHYCVQLLPEVIFSTISFTFLCYFFFYLASFFLESKPKVFSKILVAANQKTPWMIMIHNSLVCLRVRYCVQLLPEVIFSTISFTFLCYFFFYLASFFLESKPKVFSKILVAAN